MEKYEFRWLEKEHSVWAFPNPGLISREFQYRCIYEDLDGIARYTEWKTVPTEVEYV